MPFLGIPHFSWLIPILKPQELEELTWNAVKINSSPIFLAILFAVRIVLWVLAENWTLGQRGGLGLLTTIHLLRVNVFLHQILPSISFFDKMYSASSLRGKLLSFSLPDSLKLFNYIVFTIPYCLAFGYPCNYQISSYVKSLFLVFLPIC